MKAGVVVGFVLFVVATVLLWHPTTTGTTGKVTRQESLFERLGTNKIEIKEMEKPAPFFHDRTLQQKAEAATNLRRVSLEFERMKKRSKPIPMKLVSGEMPLRATSSTVGERVKKGVTYDLLSRYTIVHISVEMSCECPSGITSPPFGWVLSASDEGRQFKFVTAGVGCSQLDMDVMLRARFIRFELSVRPPVQPKGEYFTEATSVSIEGSTQ